MPGWTNDDNTKQMLLTPPLVWCLGTSEHPRTQTLRLLLTTWQTREGRGYGSCITAYVAWNVYSPQWAEGKSCNLNREKNIFKKQEDRAQGGHEQKQIKSLCLEQCESHAPALDDMHKGPLPGAPGPGTPAGAAPPTLSSRGFAQCELMHEVGRDCISVSKSYKLIFLSDSKFWKFLCKNTEAWTMWRKEKDQSWKRNIEHCKAQELKKWEKHRQKR